MLLAQQLFEGIELGKGGSVGLITYMRTDSTRCAPRALSEVREFIKVKFGDEYLPKKPFMYKAKKGAQEAHEAVRPTSSERTPDAVKEHLSRDQFRLYDLVWKRFVASQMSEIIYRTATCDIDGGECLLRASASEIAFPGFTTVYKLKRRVENGAMNKELPELSSGERLNLIDIKKEQHFTKPSGRFTEASLVRELEAKGIGRPSTYAPTISTLLDRGYVTMDRRTLFPTDLGKTVNGILVPRFPEVFAVGFTREMEELLDRVESGEKGWQEVLVQFYKPFGQRLKEAAVESKRLKESIEELTDEVCPQCGQPLVVKWGRYGKFLACKGYPDCKFTKPTEEETLQESCPDCGGVLVYKRGRYGRFVACSNYPDCSYTRAVTTGVKCPKKDCNGEIVEKTSRKGKVFYSCSRYPDCDFATWYRPVAVSCPQCGASVMVERNAKGEKRLECLDCKHKIKQ
jgi:DNA topoisomerase-1